MYRSASALFIALALAIPHASAQGARNPRLILQITVDQLRGDLPTRYYDRLSEGGFRYLWESGVVYRDAHHAHANTETIVGHTTLATGAHPSAHGTVGNLWFERETGLTTYNVEDPDYRLLTRGADVDAATEIDPTQRATRSEGRSPAALLVTTFADELRAKTGGRAKAVGVSVKDRGAISMAGHSGTVYWFSKASGEFVTSNYYRSSYPSWVDAWNAKGLVAQYGARNGACCTRRTHIYSATPTTANGRATLATSAGRSDTPTAAPRAPTTRHCSRSVRRVTSSCSTSRRLRSSASSSAKMR